MTLILVLRHVKKQLSATVTDKEPRSIPPRCAIGWVIWYSSSSRFFKLINMPKLCAPGVTRILVPVNLALSWSKPRALMPFTGQSTKKADTGGWCEVCSVMYDTLTCLLLVPT